MWSKTGMKNKLLSWAQTESRTLTCSQQGSLRLSTTPMPYLLVEEMGAAKLSESLLKRLWGRKIRLFLLLSVSPWQLKAVEVLTMKRMKFVSEAERINSYFNAAQNCSQCVDLISLSSLDAKSITQKLFCRIFFA